MRTPILPPLAALALLLAGWIDAPVLGAGPPAQASAAFPALTGRVVDQADLLAPAEEAGLSARLAALEGRTGDQLVIVTIPSLNGRTIEDFGLALGNHWHVGRRGRDNGVLIILARGERLVRIEVGYGLEAILTNARAAQIIHGDMIPALRRGRWYAALEAGTRGVIETLIAHENEPRRRQR